jgi:hypothetical protein
VPIGALSRVQNILLDSNNLGLAVFIAMMLWAAWMSGSGTVSLFSSIKVGHKSPRAEECRRLAKLAPRAEDGGHFLEMAETWDLLAKQCHEETQFADALALADAIANGRKSSHKKAA